MTITELINKFSAYDAVETVKSWTRDSQMLYYENEYMKCVRVDSANRHVANGKMSKQWSILFEKKKDFFGLPKYRELQAKMDVKIYNVHREPNGEMVKTILDFIFS